MTKLQQLKHTAIVTIKNHWLGMIPVVLLYLVAFRQIYLHNYDQLNRWKGGGFGMFSKIEERFYHIHLIKKDALECAVPPNDFSRQLSKSMTYPNYLHLEKITRELTKNIWIYSEFDPTTRKPTSVEMLPQNKSLKASQKIAYFDSIELQIYKTKFNRKTLTMQPHLIRKMRTLK